MVDSPQNNLPPHLSHGGLERGFLKQTTWHSQPLHAVIRGEKGAKVWTALSSSNTICNFLLYANNSVQHYEYEIVHHYPHI